MQIKNRDGKVILDKPDLKTLSGANLSDANLSWANLSWANLSGANLEFYNFPSIRTISSIRLSNLPDHLTTELMRRDALAHPHPDLFDEWANKGPCPYQNEEAFWIFEPKKSLWSPGPPQIEDRYLILEICKSQGWYIRNYLPMPEEKRK